MVYCGKASQGCQNCRTRRIKCDRVRPQCTQCIRVRKPCPGYRDQLSLMFRDESTKVMQKAHAQWGAEPSEAGEPSGSSPTPTSASSTRSRSLQPDAATPQAALTPRARMPSEPRGLVQEIGATPADRAMQFYIDHYVIGLPDEPTSAEELRDRQWFHTPGTRDIMAAVGMAGLSNLTGDKEMTLLANHHYGLALRNVASIIQNLARLDVEHVLRIVVMMAMYEVTRSQDQLRSPARTHLMGGAAILTNFLPLPRPPADGPRGLLQICFSMLSSLQGSFQASSPEPNVMIPSSPEPQCEGNLPATLPDWISISAKMVSEPDQSSAELIRELVRFVQLSAHVRSRPFVDGQPKTSDMIREALDINEQLGFWEARQGGVYAVTEEHTADLFPAEAVFEGRFHVYSSIYTARIWNHYRWARILVNQLLLESADKFPLSSAALFPPARQQQALDCITRTTRDVLVSVPTHYRHPALTPAHRAYFDRTKGGAGIGIAGVPVMLFQVKVAGCAPGVPRRYRAWALDMVETVYRDIGMYQAKAHAELLRKAVEREGKRVELPLRAGEVR